MRGTLGTLIGIVVVGLGLVSLGVGLAPMMTHADPNSALISVGGLAGFIASLIVMLLLVYH